MCKLCNAPNGKGADSVAQQGTKQLEQETVSPFEKFKDLASRLFNVSKEELNQELQNDEKAKERKRKD